MSVRIKENTHVVMEVVYEAVQYEPTDVIMGRIEDIETEIQTESAELKKLLGKIGFCDF